MKKLLGISLLSSALFLGGCSTLGKVIPEVDQMVFDIEEIAQLEGFDENMKLASFYQRINELKPIDTGEESERTYSINTDTDVIFTLNLNIYYSESGNYDFIIKKVRQGKELDKTFSEVENGLIAEGSLTKAQYGELIKELEKVNYEFYNVDNHEYIPELKDVLGEYKDISNIPDLRGKDESILGEYIVD